MTMPPSMSGCSGMSMSLACSPRCSSQIATTTAIATITMKAVFQNSRDARIAPTRMTAEMMAAGRSRPARPWSFWGAGVVAVMKCRARRGRSDLDELGLLVLEHLVDGVGVLLGHRVEPLLGTGHVVLADLAVLLELLEVLLGRTAQVADRDPPVLGLGARDLDVLLAALLGQ